MSSQGKTSSPLRFDLSEVSIASPHASYPDIGNSSLSEKYLSYLRSHEKPPVVLTNENLLFTNGSDAALDLFFRACCKPGDTYAITHPTFWLYQHLGNLVGAKSAIFPLRGNNLNELEISDLPKDLKLVVLCNPSNPVGSSIALSTIESLLDKTHAIVLVDEAYVEFSTKPSALRLLAHPRLAVVRSFSKAWGLAGIRGGVVISSPEILAMLRPFQLSFTIPTASIGSLELTLGETERLLKLRKACLVEKERVIAVLKSLPIVEHIYESDTNYILFRSVFAERIHATLLEAGCLLKDCRSLVENCLRITILSPSENNLALNSLKRLSQEITNEAHP